MDLKSSLRRYYAFLFLGQAVFWYSVELLLFRKRGLSTDIVVLMGMVSFGSNFLLEPITSKISDSWSRRNTLLIAMLVLLATTLYEVQAVSTWQFIAAGALWSVYRATFSGTHEAWLYDTLIAAKRSDEYRRITSRARSFETGGLFVGAIGGGLVAQWLEVEWAFWITAVLVVASIVVFARVPEPTVEGRTEQTGHVSAAAKHIIRTLPIRYVFLPIAAMMTWSLVWYEYSQLYFELAGLNAAMFGIGYAGLYLAGLVGSEISRRINFDYTRLIYCLLAAGGMSLLMTWFVSWFGLVLLFICFTLFAVSRPFTNMVIQDNTPSAIRATVLSLIGSGYKLLFFVIAPLLLFVEIRVGLIVMSCIYVMAVALYAGLQRTQTKP